MNIFNALAAGVLSAALCAPTLAFDWDYTEARFDLTADAILGPPSEFASWRVEPFSRLTEQFETVITAGPIIEGFRQEQDPDRTGYTLTEVQLKFAGLADGGADFDYSVSIARPLGQRNAKVVLAINGHGEVGGEGHGEAPRTLFLPGAYGDYLAKQGYVVVAFPNTMHDTLEELHAETDFSTIWARMADLALDQIMAQLPADASFVSVGNAAGGLTSLVLTIMRDDIIALTTNGAFFSLEHTRREYRISTHPFCHDFREFLSYSAVYALAAPKPVLLQMGKGDALWLGAGPAPSQGDWFSGMKRGAISDETVGSYLQLKNIWNGLGSDINLSIHDAGHEDMDGLAVEAFISSLPEASLSPTDAARAN